MNRHRRTIFLVDREVQGTLMVRVALYWLFWLLSISLMIVCWNAYNGPSRRFVDLLTDLYFRHGPALAASLIVLPVVMMDALRLSNRFVGPIFRLRQGLRELADGKPTQPLNFRDNDFWRELGDEFNRAAATVRSHQGPSDATTEQLHDVLA